MTARRSNPTVWKQLFVAALIELNGSKFRARIVAAQNAIALRKRELEIEAKRDNAWESEALETAAKRLALESDALEDAAKASRITNVKARTDK